MVKPTKRKGFTFLRSYFDVLNELKEDDDKLDFLLAIINKQFFDENPKGLKFIPNLCYESQRHNIEKSVKGWKTATNNTFLGDPPDPPKGDPEGDPPTPSQEEQLEEEEKEQLEEKEQSNSSQVVSQPADEIDFDSLLNFIKEKTGRKFRKINTATRQKIKARIKEGFTSADFGNAITNAIKMDYHKNNGFQYLTPEFFSRATTLEKYGTNTNTQIKNESNENDGRETMQDRAKKWFGDAE